MYEKKVTPDMRRNLTQDVIDRCIEHDKDYYDALCQFNKDYEIKNRKNYVKDKDGDS